MTSGIVRGFEPVYIDVSGYELSAVALGAIDLAPDGRQSGAAAAYSCQLVGPGIFAVPGGLCAIFRCNLAVVAALCAIVSCNLAVVDCPDAAVRRLGLPAAHRRQLVGPGIFAILSGVCAIFGRNFAVIDGSHAAVGSLSPPRIGPGAFVRRALTVACRAIPRGSVAISGGVVTRFGLSITQPGRDVTIPRGQPGLPPTHSRQLVGAGILAVSCRLCAIVRRNLAVVDGSFAAVRGISTP